MKKIMFILLVFSLAILSVIPCFSKDYKKLGTAGMKFLDIDPSARSIAMGGAANSICNDASSMFINPAGLASVSSIEFNVNYNSWIADIKQYALGVAIQLDNIGLNWFGGTVGFSLLYTDNGNMIHTEYLSNYDDYYQYEEPYTIEEWAVGLAYAKSITNKFSFGGHVRYAVQDLGETAIWRAVEDDTIAVGNRLDPYVFDFGTIYYTGFKDLRLSMSFRNFSKELIYVRDKFELPITMKIGIAIDALSIFLPKKDYQSLILAIDAIHPRDYTERIHLGLEYLFYNFALRTGYKFNYDEESFCAGFGVNQNIGTVAFKFDYAYTSFGIFNSVHRFSMGFSF